MEHKDPRIGGIFPNIKNYKLSELIGANCPKWRCWVRTKS